MGGDPENSSPSLAGRKASPGMEAGRMASGGKGCCLGSGREPESPGCVGMLCASSRVVRCVDSVAGCRASRVGTVGQPRKASAGNEPRLCDAWRPKPLWIFWDTAGTPLGSADPGTTLVTSGKKLDPSQKFLEALKILMTV